VDGEIIFQDFLLQQQQQQLKQQHSDKEAQSFFHFNKCLVGLLALSNSLSLLLMGL